MKKEYKDPRCQEGEHEWDTIKSEENNPIVMCLLGGSKNISLHCKKCKVWRYVLTK